MASPSKADYGRHRESLRTIQPSSSSAGEQSLLSSSPLAAPIAPQDAGVASARAGGKRKSPESHAAAPSPVKQSRIPSESDCGCVLRRWP